MFLLYKSPIKLLFFLQKLIQSALEKEATEASSGIRHSLRGDRVTAPILGSHGTELFFELVIEKYFKENQKPFLNIFMGIYFL
jgi:hypothetical protein